jgi:hypothetical protein
MRPTRARLDKREVAVRAGVNGMSEGVIIIF